jgi:transposase
LPQYVKAQISRELDRLELVLEQIKTVEKERDRVLLSPAPVAAVNTGPEAACDNPTGASGVAMLTALRGTGANGATKLWSEGLSRHFSNRRQIAAYSGLAPTPWQSGGIAHEQGVSKAGNPRLRTTMVEIAWLWLQHQPQSALARWYFARVGVGATKARKKVAITALARKLLVALWKYVTAGELIEGAIMNPVA